MSETYIMYAPCGGTGVRPLLVSDVERVLNGDTLFCGSTIELDLRYLITRDHRIIECRYTNNEFEGPWTTYREISPAEFIAANCPPDGRLPPDLSWIGVLQAPQSDPARETINPSLPSGESTPESDADVWISFAEAHTLTALENWEITRVCDSGKIKSQGKRKGRKVHKEDLIKYMLGRPKKDS